MGADLVLALLDAANFVLAIILVAMGLMVVFGMMRIINMAHGELFLLGAYALLVVQGLGGSFWLALVLGPLAVGLVGWLLEVLVIRHLYGRVLDSILATWGLSLLIRQAVILWFGPQSKVVAAPFDLRLDIMGQPFPAYRLFIMGVSLIVILLCFWLFHRTRLGLAARATIADRATAEAMGIDSRRLDRLTFAFGAGLAGLAGVVMAPLLSVDPQMGLGFLIPAFLAILTGGAGELMGVVTGGVVVGGSQSLVARVASPAVAELVVLGLAILVIRLLPNGLVGHFRQRR